MAASRIIIFNPDETKYLVGKESYFISNIKDITVDMQFFMDALFSRRIQKIKSHNDKDEINYYTKKIPILVKNNAIMKIIKDHSDSTRITFGDIRYKTIDSHVYSYTLPQYLPTDIKYSFPGGQPSNANTDTTCASFQQDVMFVQDLSLSYPKVRTSHPYTCSWFLIPICISTVT